MAAAAAAEEAVKNTTTTIMMHGVLAKEPVKAHSFFLTRYYLASCPARRLSTGLFLEDLGARGGDINGIENTGAMGLGGLFP